MCARPHSSWGKLFLFWESAVPSIAYNHSTSANARHSKGKFRKSLIDRQDSNWGLQTHPNPLDRPVSAFFMTTQSMTSPNREKYRKRLSWVVSQLQEKTKSIRTLTKIESVRTIELHQYWSGITTCCFMIFKIN